MTLTAEHASKSSSKGIAGIADAAGSAFSLGVEAYLWGYPLVLMERTKAIMTNPAHCNSAPINTFRHASRLLSPRDREIVKPNNDTLYSFAWLDLTNGPQILAVPDTGDRYYSIHFLDAFTNTCAYIGRRTTGTAAGRYVVVGPQWQGELPDLPVLSIPTNTVWLLGRTLVDGESDMPATEELINQYQLAPVQSGGGEPRWTVGPVVSPHTIGQSGLSFFDELCAALELNPTPVLEAGLMEKFEAIGVGRGRTPSREIADDGTRIALEYSVSFANDMLNAKRLGSGSRTKNPGWSYANDLGDYGQNYLLRSVIALLGLGALTAEEAIYASVLSDETGDRLNGTYSYVLHFDTDKLPPVDAFWSLTVYDDESFLAENPMNRYAIGDRTPGLVYRPDGSLDIFIQHSEPAEGEANWLPVPAGPFELTLRFYQPREEMLEGRYVVPPVQRT
ncbi:DUF1254 domain-containing protein [Rhodococcus sp. IEGM 1318]|uniref:DUF1254 domain-containing protein n=1 Tax=Rhodococcus sp. IEGM 1318 TaxID=3082226 RepID=UPI002953EBEB|nr:DUF1254 domain-containing protein [Rhodococcus sp. IEGM 1318]MDV8009369.1 DUF1254 domain-containing protein [Rhodococcus sp. IEGM 1318]